MNPLAAGRTRFNSTYSFLAVLVSLIYKVSRIDPNGPHQADRAQVDRRQGEWGVRHGARVKTRSVMRRLAQRVVGPGGCVAPGATRSLLGALKLDPDSTISTA